MDDHHISCKHPFWLPVLLVFILGGMYIVGKYIESQDLTPVVISVQGEGRVFASPDVAQISFGMQTGRQKTAEKALDVLSDRMNAVFAALKDQGIEEKDITTEFLSLNPAYDWQNGVRIDRGFEANQSLRVKIRDLEKVGDVLSVATAAGANQAGGVSFTIDDPEELREAAREKAITNGAEKAEKLAVQLGKKLGKLRGFADGGVPVPVYGKNIVMESIGIGGGGGGPAPVPSGEQEIRVLVNLSYELK